MAAADVKALINKRKNDIQKARADKTAVTLATFESWLTEIAVAVDA